ncbi:glycoside hydrolase family 9 protein [Agarivorans sp. Z349TD_8]|uniref:glycoside hydrolase family 9 protein n=1 Tax=Agarivorans sp. Z349TD_8 TaxID=3421434 RepID=UPI003D7D43EB
MKIPAMLCIVLAIFSPQLMAMMSPSLTGATTLSLRFEQAPQAQWNKQRISARLTADQRAFILQDQQQHAFNDAELFKLSISQTLPYGRKLLYFKLHLVDDFKPLWGQKILQLKVDGKELEPAKAANGKALWHKVLEEDNKGFIPAGLSELWFELPSDSTEIKFMTMMTAGAERFQAELSDFIIYSWPESDQRTQAYQVRFNHDGYLKHTASPVLIELPDWIEQSQLPVSINAVGVEPQELMLTIPSQSDPGSGMKVVGLDLANLNTRFTGKPLTLQIDSIHPQLTNTRISLKQGLDLSSLQRHRDQALAAFYYFDSSDLGPYSGTHHQDSRAKRLDSESTLDVRGGWFDAGDYGKYSVNAAYSLMTLLMAEQLQPAAFAVNISPIASDQGSDLLALLSSELNLLLKLQADNGGVYHKAASAQWPPLAQAPQQDHQIKTVLPITTTATAHSAAAFAMAANSFAQSRQLTHQQQALQYRQAALRAWAYLEAHPQLEMIKQRYHQFEYGGPYDDVDDRDERLLAALALYQMTGEVHYLNHSKQYLVSLLELPRLGDPSPSWRDNRSRSALLYLKAAPKNDDLYPSVHQALSHYLEHILSLQQNNPYGIAFAGHQQQFDWGSNGIIASTGFQLLYGGYLLDKPAWQAAAMQLSHWFFGLNPHGKIFVVGDTPNHVQHPHFRPYVSKASPLPVGLLIGGANSVELKGDMMAATRENMAPMQVYIDHQDSWASNEVAINWQALWAAYLCLLNQSLANNLQ